MPKIKFSTIEQEVDEHIKRHSSMMPDLNNNLSNELIKIKSLLKTGVLTKDCYDLFEKQNQNNFELNLSLMMFRDLYIHNYGFFIVSEDFLEKSVKFFSDSKILEVGAGSGFLSACLQGYGIDVTPTDLHTENNDYGFTQMHTNVLQKDSIDYLKINNDKFDTVLMSWPDYCSTFAYDVLKNMKSGQTLIYIGESEGGCTANDNFFYSLQHSAKLMNLKTKEFNKNSFSWFGIHDHVNIYKIK